ncbi:MAG: hypothetical protein QOI05_720 [Bradyrhizobium sp.]|jgi:hypothetical protein|nr:hypothetical protein [Bradyrhizobium sp.]
MDTRVKPAYDAERVAAPCFNFQIHVSNSHTFAFSRRNASEVCKIPREPREGMERWEAPGHQWAPLRRVVSPPRAARQPRAPKARRSASQRSTNHQAVDRSGAPVRPAFALSAERIASRKRSRIEQDTSRISEVLGTGIRNAKNFFRQQLQPRAPDAAQRVALRGAVRCRAGAPVTLLLEETGVPVLRSSASRRATP